MSYFEMGTRKGDRGIFDQLLSWTDRLRARDLYPLGLEEQITTLERLLLDINDGKIEEAVILKLSFWFEIINKYDPDKETAEATDATSCQPKEIVDAIPSLTDADKTQLRDSLIEVFRVNALRMIEVLAQWKGPETIDAVLRKLQDIGINPPDNWQPKTIGLSFDVAELFPVVIEKLRQEAESHSLDKTLQRLDRIIFMANEALKPTECTNFMPKLQELLDANSKTYEHTSFVRQVDSGKTELEATRCALADNAKYVWEIDLNFSSKSVSSTNAGYLLWTFGTALEQIRGVLVQIESWGKGSLWTKLKVFISNIWARDEVQEILEKSREAVIAECLDKRIEYAKKLKAEREILEEERKTIEKQLKTLPDADEAEFSRHQDRKLKELEIREKEVDIRHKEISNRIRELECIEKTSRLIADGIISVDKVRIDINGLLYLLVDEKHAERGSSLKEIGDSEKAFRTENKKNLKKEF